jgi:hypothetical protein
MSDKSFRDSIRKTVVDFLEKYKFNVEVDDSRSLYLIFKFNNVDFGESTLEIWFCHGFSNVVFFNGCPSVPFEKSSEVERYMYNYGYKAVFYPIPKTHLLWSCIDKLASIVAVLANDGRGAHDDCALDPQRPRDGQLDKQRAVVKV